MRLGDVGIKVEDLQSYLISKGYLDVREYNYGPKTKRAVMKVQEFLGYRQTGVWESDLELLEELVRQEEVRRVSLRPRFGFGDITGIAGNIVPGVGDKVKIMVDGCFGGTASDAGKKYPEIIKGIPFNVIKDNPVANEILVDKINSWIPKDVVNVISDAFNLDDKLGPLDDLGIKSSIVTKEKNVTPNKSLTLPYTVDLIPCYAINTNTGTKTEFYCTPEQISETMSASYEDQTTKSRTSPYKAYANSGPREVNFSVQISADYCPIGIVKTVRQLQALTLPAKSGGYIAAPSCYLRIGDFIAINGVCNSVDVTWNKPYKDGVYSVAEVSLAFSEVQDKSVYTDEHEALTI